MKKFVLAATIAALSLGASAQSSDAPASYSLAGISYDNTHLGGKNFEFGSKESMGLNGFGLEYTYGHRLSSTLPMYLEAGLKFNMGFGSVTESDEEEDYKLSMQQMRFSLPISFAWRFNATENLAVTPYAGIDFRYNAMWRVKDEYESEGEKEEYDWVSLFDKDKIGEDETWNRFQMGWHIGVRAEYNRVFLGLSYGTDFIHAFKYDEDGYKSHVSTGNLAVTVGYRF